MSLVRMLTWVAARTVADPFIYHTQDMVSTWEFFNYHSRLSFGPTLFAWNDAVAEASRHGSSAITHPMTWSGAFGGEIADLELIPLQGMTWNMLAEAARGAAMVNGQKREYQFIVRANDVADEVGYGRMTMRRSSRFDRSLGVRDVEARSSLTLPTNLTAHLPGVTNLYG